MKKGMGQGMAAGAAAGASVSLLTLPMQYSTAQYLSMFGTGVLGGLAVDFASDCVAKVGKPIIHREVVLNAPDILRHVSTFYTTNRVNPVSKFLRQKHEWLILESHTNKYYVVQKDPATGNLLMDVRMSARTANDLGLAVAGQPTHTGEIRQHRRDQEFDLPNDLQVAYVIAWLRKEDPRWSFSTENSRHFTTKLRSALNDF
jgi:hypothetical protein